MKTKIWLSIALVVAGLAALPLSAQNFPTTKGDDGPVASFGAFWILVDPPYQPLFAGCPATVYNPTTHILQSGTLYDNITTIIGHSKGIKEGSPEDNGGVAVGSAGTMVRDGDMNPPPSFSPILPGSNEVHTELRHLNMEKYPGGGPPRVRAGVCYQNIGCSPTAPPPVNRISRGEVVSNHVPAGAPPDFPARSYFNVFAQIEIPACGGFPGATVFNQDPLKVHTPSISGFPPSGVVYMHDSSSAVGVRFTKPANWQKGKGKRLGCVILAGHGIIPTFPPRAAASENAPTVEPVAFQGYGREQRKVAPKPSKEKEEVDKEAAKFQEHINGEFQREGGRHKDCGPKGKDD